MRYFALLLAAVFFGFTACKPRNGSQLKHDFGATSRVPADYAFQDCEISYQGQKRFPKTQKYLESIARFIMEKNPKTFTGPIAPDKFCIDIVYDAVPNASANLVNRKIEFRTSLVLAVDNDAEIASVMAHELSHITLMHAVTHHPKYVPSKEAADLFTTRAELAKKVAPTFAAAERIGKQVLTELEQLGGPAMTTKQDEFMKMYDTMYDTAFTGQNKINLRSYADTRNAFLTGIDEPVRTAVASKLDEVINLINESTPAIKQLAQIEFRTAEYTMKAPEVGLEEGMNWSEQEADEAGFELYRRAGFRDQEFFDLLSILAAFTLSQKDIYACMRESFRAHRSGNKTQHVSEPVRGTSTHPEMCWRIYDHFREEMLHEKDYEAFPNNLVILSPSGLPDARAEIQSESRMLPPNPFPGPGPGPGPAPGPGGY
jgi:Peptidase family M48